MYYFCHIYSAERSHVLYPLAKSTTPNHATATLIMDAEVAKKSELEGWDHDTGFFGSIEPEVDWIYAFRYDATVPVQFSVDEEVYGWIDWDNLVKEY